MFFFFRSFLLHLFCIPSSFFFLYICIINKSSQYSVRFQIQQNFDRSIRVQGSLIHSVDLVYSHPSTQPQSNNYYYYLNHINLSISSFEVPFVKSLLQQNLRSSTLIFCLSLQKVKFCILSSISVKLDNLIRERRWCY